MNARLQLAARLSPLLAAAFLIFGGLLLAHAGATGAAALRGPSGARLLALVLLALAGAAVVAPRVLKRLADGFALDFRAPLVVAQTATPGIVFLLTAPGMIGFSWAAELSSLGVVGDLALGVPGLALACASACGVGAALVSSLDPDVPVESIIDAYEQLRNPPR